MAFFQFSNKIHFNCQKPPIQETYKGTEPVKIIYSKVWKYFGIPLHKSLTKRSAKHINRQSWMGWSKTTLALLPNSKKFKIPNTLVVYGFRDLGVRLGLVNQIFLSLEKRKINCTLLKLLSWKLLVKPIVNMVNN